MALKVSKNTFFIPIGNGQFICYLPLAGIKIKVDGFAKRFLEELQTGKADTQNPINRKLIEYFKKEGVINPKEVDYALEPISQIKPISIGFMPTLDCNLRCGYCYSNSGAEKNELDFEAAKAGVDLVIKNAIEMKRKSVSFTFMGGGEPTYNWPLFKKIASYCIDQSRKNSIKPLLNGSTNGVLSEKQVSWIAQHFDHIQISFDGPEDIQNKNRPFAGGQGSFNDVFRTIKKFDEMRFPYTVSVVVTPETVYRMAEVVDLFKGYSPHFLKFGLLSCGQKETAALDSELFWREFKNAREVARKNKIKLYDFWDFGEIILSPCYVHNFVLIPGGHVSSCLKVSSPKEKFSDRFIYGKYDSRQKKFVFFPEKINALIEYFNSFNKLLDRKCNSCYAKFQCGMGCPHANLSFTSTLRKNKKLCILYKQRVLEDLVK